MSRASRREAHQAALAADADIRRRGRDDWRRRCIRGLWSLASLAAAAALIVWAMPAVSGVGWGRVLAEFAGLRAWQLLMLTALWLAGLWVYSFVLTASLPGLRNWQGFTLNTVGSAISNLLPFGGAAGVAMLYALTASWGFSRRAVTASALVTGIWNLLARLALPAAGALLLVAGGVIPDRRIIAAVVITSIILAGAVIAIVLVLRSVTVADHLGAAALDLAALLLPARWRPRPGGIVAAVRRLQATTADLIRRAWPRLTLATAAYLGLQAALLAGCLRAAGLHLPVTETLAAFAVNRALTAAVVTPGGCRNHRNRNPGAATHPRCTSPSSHRRGAAVRGLHLRTRDPSRRPRLGRRPHPPPTQTTLPHPLPQLIRPLRG
jgi:putative heme transporter